MSASAFTTASEFCRAATDAGVSVHSPGVTQRYLEFVFEGLPLAGQHVLDVGGGRGLCSFWANQAGAASVTCVEPLAEGSQSYATGVFSAFREMIGASDVSLKSESIEDHRPAVTYDLVVLHDSLNHLDERAYSTVHNSDQAAGRYVQILRRIRGMVVEGGHILVTDCSRRNLFGDLGARAPAAPTIQWSIHQTPATVGRLLARSGFRPLEHRWTPLRRLGRIGFLVGKTAPGAYVLHSHFVIHGVATTAGLGQ